MVADYNRYISEYSQGDRLEEVTAKANENYKKAIEIAAQSLTTTNPVRLGLYLNYSVFCYEVINFLFDNLIETNKFYQFN